jgi:hypothetical protein
VVEHYVDGSYKFAGLGSFMLYLLRTRRPEAELTDPEEGSHSC